MVCLLGPALMGCQGPPAPAEAAWTLPHAQGWVVRWRGARPVAVDGQPVPAEAGQAVLDDGRPHTVQVGALQWTVPARAPDPAAPLQVAVLGDGRATVDHVGPSAYWAGILGEALATDPAFVINTGDLVKRGTHPHEWARYLATLPPWPPVVAVRGNHDRGGLFEVLGVGVGPVFGWTVGPARFVFFDSEGEDAAVRARLPALAQALAEGGARWKVVVLHRPVWSRGNHGSDDRGLNAALVPLLERAGVTLVLSGHDHDYERFCPSLGVGPARRCDPAGVTYLVTGGAATLTVPLPGLSRRVDSATAAQDRAMSRAFSGSHHFVTLRFEADRIEGTAHRTRTGNLRPAGVFDRFVIAR
ncbi:MAG: metallophosphoesterase [Myxococcales bacterium]|nr:metallophosphoesterase [Myxococcales bacterium]